MKEIDIDYMLRSRRGDAPSVDSNDDEDYEMVTAPLLKSTSGTSRLSVFSMICGKRGLRWFHRQWSLMSSRRRTFASVLLLFCSMYIFLEMIDWFYLYQGFDGRNNLSFTTTSLKKNTSSDSLSFSVVINTYKRPKALSEAVQHYAVTCGRAVGVQTVFVIWSELDQTPPDSASLLNHPQQQQQQNVRRHTTTTTTTTTTDRSSDVIILRMTQNSLNSRFLPISQLTTDAVFMVDDDVRVSCRSLRDGFQAWTAVPDAMVGYYPRLASTTSSIKSPKDHSPENNQEYIYHSWPTVFLRQKINFVLTKASFFHRKYMELYSSNQHPQEIRDYVDRFKNCEDVAMSLLVANATSSSSSSANPIYMEGSISDKGLFGGISTGSGHMARRSQCLTDLTLVYQKHGWGSPLATGVSLRDHAWTHHAFAWQYRPANFFEWFALGNFFKS